MPDGIEITNLVSSGALQPTDHVVVSRPNGQVLMQCSMADIATYVLNSDRLDAALTTWLQSRTAPTAGSPHWWNNAGTPNYS